MKIIKKWKWLILILTLVMLLIIIVYLSKFLLNRDVSVYGNRLDGLKQVEIKEDLKNDIISSLKEVQGLKKVKIDIRGKIINLMITFEQDLALVKAQELVETEVINLFKKFTKEQLKFYDFQFCLTGDGDEEHLTSIGYKSKHSTIITWNNSSLGGKE